MSDFVIVIKDASDLRPGDVCEGPGLFVLTGTVESVDALDDGRVRINWRGRFPAWRGGFHTDRPADAEVRVRVPRDAPHGG